MVSRYPGTRRSRAICARITLNGSWDGVPPVLRTLNCLTQTDAFSCPVMLYVVSARNNKFVVTKTRPHPRQ